MRRCAAALLRGRVKARRRMRGVAGWARASAARRRADRVKRGQIADGRPRESTVVGSATCRAVVNTFVSYVRRVSVIPSQCVVSCACRVVLGFGITHPPQ